MASEPGGFSDEVTFVLRLESGYILADGFEQGRASLWSAVTLP